ncbi:MAG: TIGR01777 family oxidoreductase [Sedimentisphaerales bacterium]|nr:TIGR01777 family oxidoreductase [Sedimentisphaerales bacterium]
MSKRIVITGGTGFIGSALCRSLVDAGHNVVILSRRAQHEGDVKSEAIKIVRWDGANVGDWVTEVDGAFAIINLAGENLANGRWTAEKKERILDSRIQAGTVLLESIRQAVHKPEVWVQASAIGIYGSRGDALLDEAAGAGDGFLAEVAQQWEASVDDVCEYGVRLVVLRFGVVLGNSGGMLSHLLGVFRKGLGGPWGSGRQWLSWVHLADVIGVIRFALEDTRVDGVFNLVSPGAVQVAEFARVLGRTIHRPTIFRTPGFMLKLAFGSEMAREMLLAGQRVTAQRLLNAGYSFQFADLAEALDDLLGQNAT